MGESTHGGRGRFVVEEELQNLSFVDGARCSGIAAERESGDSDALDAARGVRPPGAPDAYVHGVSRGHTE
jgi:hypothetical protein